jgi:CheY-like chemotaxis protein
LARRILLADDSVTAQNMGRRILTDAGYEVVTVNNGSAALKKIAENKPDLIVLDVYMPGYGGLEVCQRVKENPETRRIPVLLTVGKLEPFKADEARRVGADSFIIKPFEATELLTVLTKLEDKIVAQPQPQKSGRFAKALAAVESDRADRFGDQETGWKSRLIIPSPNSTPRAEEEAPATVAAASRDPQEAEAVKPVEPPHGFERPIPAGLPADITPEEIAAITAAAAAFGGNAEQPAIPEAVVQSAVVSQEVATPEAAAVQTSEAEAPAVTLASGPVASQEIAAEVPAVSEAVASDEALRAQDRQDEVRQDPARQDENRGIEDHQTETLAAVTELPPTTSNSEATINSEIQISEPAQPAAGDAEVMAAIASLAPTNGHAIEGIQPGGRGSNGTGHAAASSAYTSALAAEVISGPRWIAEPVEMALEESKLTLHQEMEQVHAARASAEAASLSATIAAASSIPVAVLEPAVFEPIASVPVVHEPVVPEAIAPPMETVIAAQASTESATPAVSSPAAIAAEASVIESEVPASGIISGTTEASTVQPNEPVVAEESAYAAAASAGAVAEQATPIEAVSTTTAVPQNNATAEAESAPPRGAELAAAWQNWKHIRESFVGSRPLAPAAESPAEAKPEHEEKPAAVQSTAADAVAEPVEAEEAASDVPEESSAIASIVDSMLAELRPKLVEEIAKKMNSEKKEKDKKKKK